MKVNLSNSKHNKSYFPISIDSSSTANFGECLPLFCHELPPNSHCTINVRDAVRFAPLSFPTFGKAFLKTYSFCHKISDLYPPFNDLLAQTPYTSFSGSTYVPSSVPSLPLWFLWLTVLSNCEFTFYKTDFTKVKSYSSDSSHPFVVSDLDYSIVDTITYTDGSTTTNPDLDSVSGTLPYLILYTLQNGVSTLSSSVAASFGTSMAPYVQYMENQGITSDDLLFYSRFGNNIGSVYCPPAGGTRAAVTPGSADFIVPISTSVPGMLRRSGTGVGTFSFMWNKFSYVSSNNPTLNNSLKDVFVCIRLTDSGKFLRKILMGLGYQIAPINKQVSILPLFAYFKSYFETFAPKRFVKFDQTSFSRLINSCVNTGKSIQDLITNRVINSNYPLSGEISWNYIIDDLLSCYYTKNTDYFSAQIIGMINDYGNDLNQKFLGVYRDSGSDPNEQLQTIVSDVAAGVVPSVNLTTDTGYMHTQSQQNILSRLTQFVNRRSVAGSKIASLLKSVFGISPKEVEDNNFFLGSDSIDVNFGDVFSTAETAEGSLGEYAGKAVASGSGGVYNVDTDCHSLIFSFSVIVPRTQYVQGVNPILSHVKGTDFYNPMFDGLTLLPTSRTALYCGDGNYAHDDSTSFGNLPIYSEYKTKVCGILTGDLSLNSTRSTYDSFTMDELISSSTLITDNSEDVTPANISGSYQNIHYDYNKLVCGTMWRYLGRWLWLGRFDRIFVNNRINFTDFLSSVLPTSVDGDLQSTRNTIRTDDNLVVHHVIDLNINSAMVPLAGSWMTDDMLSLDQDGVMVQSE